MSIIKNESKQNQRPYKDCLNTINKLFLNKVLFNEKLFAFYVSGEPKRSEQYYNK